MSVSLEKTVNRTKSSKTSNIRNKIQDGNSTENTLCLTILRCSNWAGTLSWQVSRGQLQWPKRQRGYKHLAKRFWFAGERYRSLDMEQVPLEDQYEMCGLFKQSTFGDIDIKCEYIKKWCSYEAYLEPEYEPNERCRLLPVISYSRRLSRTCAPELPGLAISARYEQGGRY